MAAGTPAGADSTAAMAFLRKSPVAILLLTALAALLVALRILQRDELWSDHTWWLVAIAACGGFFGTAGTRMLLAAPPLRRLAARSPRVVSAALFAGLLMLGMMTAYVAQSLTFGGQFEPHPDRPIRAVIVNAIQTAALFLISCPTYLLPWPLPMLTGLAAFLLPPGSAKPVERSGDGV